MEILAHRGFWRSPGEKNSERAFLRALEFGYGIETDLRDYRGTLVISHDIADESSMLFDRFLELYLAGHSRPTLALNIKADGLQSLVDDALKRHGVRNYFVFDMSVPDALGYLARGMRTFLRRSEFEPASRLEEEADGLWLDAFQVPAVEATTVERQLSAGRRVAIVSPELHGKPHRDAWESWRELLGGNDARSMLCTDFPDEAEVFFKKAGG